MNESSPTPTLGLMSIFDIMRQFPPERFFDLARMLTQMETILERWNSLGGESPVEQARTALGFMQAYCAAADLTLSEQTIRDITKQGNPDPGVLATVQTLVRNEMERNLYFSVPADRAKFWENDSFLSDQAKTAFPGSASEIRCAANCYACGQYTATVFHAMRAAEVGARRLAKTLEVPMAEAIELQEMAVVIEQIEAKIKEARKAKRGEEKEANLNFLSTAAAQFVYFKDGWRVRVAHGRATYEQPQALSVLTGVRDFFEALSARVQETDDGAASPS